MRATSALAAKIVAMNESALDASNRSPARELLANADFRHFWLAQVIVFGVNGTARFMFVWLMVTLTDWSAAEGLVSMAYGVPALVLSLHAGAWSDRTDRRRFCLWWMGLGSVAFAVVAGLVGADVMAPRLAGLAASVVGTFLVMMQPNLNAIVPLLVSRERLMNAAAIQNAGAQVASFSGLAVGGLIISLLGNAAGFALLAVLMGLAYMLMRRVTLPSDPVVESRQRVGIEIIEGLRYGLGSEPRRSLLLTTLVLGSSFSAMAITMPRVVDEDFGRGSFSAGLLLGSFGLGMLASSAYVATRGREMRHGRNVAIFIGIGLGLGQFLLSLAPNYGVSVVVMVAWGLNAGIAIASHRTLLQHNTEPAMMGRVMGIMTLGYSGGLPFGALLQAVLAPAVGPVLTMRWVGLATMAITMPLLLFRRAIRDR